MTQTIRLVRRDFSAVTEELFRSGESREEQIQDMREFAAASWGSTNESSEILENMLDRFSTEYQTRNNPSIAGPTPTTPTTPEHKDDSSNSSTQSDDTPQNQVTTDKTDDEESGSCCTAP